MAHRGPGGALFANMPKKRPKSSAAPRPSELAKFIASSSTQIISEWEDFARSCVPAANSMDIVERRDHIEGMLKTIALDLRTPQTRKEQTAKGKGDGDATVHTDSSANSHGSDRAALGYTPVQMVAEFRALRASILKLWSMSHSPKSKVGYRETVEEVTRFNEAIDQLLAESIATYVRNIEGSKDLFLGVIGHDLRNPLGAIMMSATVMMTEEGPEWSHSRSASRILNSCTRMERIISDLMDVTRSRLGSGIPIQRIAMDLEVVGRHTADEISAFHPGCEVQIETSGDLKGDWDPGRIGQLLSNLIGNAYQHGQDKAPIKVTLLGQPSQVVVKVHNLGPVIAPGDMQDIFNPFRQLAPARGKAKAMGSVGLGLYIAQSIVIAHEGRIDVTSTTGGTTFKVSLPRTGTIPADSAPS